MTTHTSKSSLQTNFEEAFANVRQVPFQSEWKHGSYMNGACQYQLEPGVIVCAQAEEPDSRRMLLVGTRAGTAVVFERYTPGADNAFVLVSNAPAAVRFILPSGSIDEQVFHSFVNPHRTTDNLGSRLEAVFLAKPSLNMMVG